MLDTLTTSDRYHGSSHYIDFDDDFQGVNMGVFLYPVMDLQKCCICQLHLNVCYWYCAYIETFFGSDYFGYAKT